MFSLARRNFLKSVYTFSSVFSLNVLIDSNFVLDYSNKFFCQDFYLMGTYGKISIFYDNLEHGKFLIEKSLLRIKSLESSLTKFSPYSDIGIINNNPNEWCNISSDSMHLLKIGMNISDLTKGYFDMGLGNILSFSGIDSFVPLVGKVTSNIDMSDKLILFDGNNVKLNRKNSMLDLGGIGKGYAIDECVNILLDSGVKHIAVEFGGDIRVVGGMPDNLPWKISFDKRLFSYLNKDFPDFYYKDCSLAMSGRYLKKSSFSNHHIIDPFSLSSKFNYLFLLVLGKECVFCDALSTAFFNMDVIDINKIIFRYPQYSFLPFF